MNNSFDKTFDKNFNEALNLLKSNYTQDDLLHLLEAGNPIERQFAALQLKHIKSVQDISAILNNLVGQDGKIREIISLRISEFTSNKDFLQIFEKYNQDKLSDYMLAAVVDVNANICRNIIATLNNLKNNNNFVCIFVEKLTKSIIKLIDKILKFDIKQGKYRINKEIFKLYWSLEALNIYYDKINVDDLKKILNYTKSIDEYTIREKTAKILTNDINDNDLYHIKQMLKHDENYYVRRF